jgi:hypothetical protein
MKSKEASSEIAERMKPEKYRVRFDNYKTIFHHFRTAGWCARTKLRPPAVESTQGLWLTDIEDEDDGIQTAENRKGMKIALLGSILRWFEA